MKKNEFLRELEYALKYKLSQEDINEIISDYTDIFNSGIEEGKSEDDVSYEIGSPANIARTILDETNGETLDKNLKEKDTKQDFSNLAPMSKRFGAYVIDTFITSLIVALVLFTTTFAFYGVSSISVEEKVTEQNERVMEDSYEKKTTLYKSNGKTKIELLKNNERIFKGNTEEYWGFLEENKIKEEDINTRQTITKEPFRFSNMFAIFNIALFLMFFGFSNIITALETYFFKGYTLGKWLLKIRVQRIDGQKVSFWDAVLRDAIIKSIGNSVSSGILNIGSFIWGCATVDHKTVHDVASKTKVVKVMG